MEVRDNERTGYWKDYAVWFCGQLLQTAGYGGGFPPAFGQAVVYGTSGTVTPVGESTTAADFVGVAAREVKTATNYLDQSAGAYNPGEVVSVFKRGRINVLCQNGSPAFGGDVYVRVKLNKSSYPNAVVGGFEAAADSSNSVKLTNAKWRGPADANGVAELSILNMINV